jgi:hypothetical protein
MKSALAFAAVFCLLMSHSDFAEPIRDGSALPDFRGRVRFHYREKNVSAPASTDEDLPAAQFLPEKQRRIIEGKVRDLPFMFYLRLTRPDPSRAPLLEVNVVDPATRRSIQGFPVEQDLKEAGGSFELPLSEAQKRGARRAVGDDDQIFITYVNLIVNLATEQ